MRHNNVAVDAVAPTRSSIHVGLAAAPRRDGARDPVR